VEDDAFERKRKRPQGTVPATPKHAKRVNHEEKISRKKKRGEEAQVKEERRKVHEAFTRAAMVSTTVFGNA